MDLKTFTDNFSVFAGAPNSIPKLREMILQLAVKGRLVPQDPKDEPACVLLEKVGFEKNRLVACGKLKKSKSPSSIDRDAFRYEIPGCWAWSRLSEVGIVNPRNEAQDDAEAGFVPMPLISAGYGIVPHFETRRWKDIKKGFTHFAEGDVAVAKITPCFQNGKSAVFRGLPNGIGAGTTELHVFRSVANTVVPEYVWIYLKSPQFLLDGESKMTGSAGQKRVPKNYFADNPFPLPPLAEQKRIVAKVDELMAICDHLEEQKNQRDQVSSRMNTGCLHELTSPDPANLRKGWSRIRENFDLLYNTPENVSALRQSILQLAVMGKLIPQDPNDEPASVLLERMAAEKELLVAEGKIKKSKPLPPIGPDEVPYDLPEGWEWLRLGEVVELISGQHLLSNEYNEQRQGTPYITGPADFGPAYPVISKWTEKPKAIARDGDILITVKGAGIGKSNVVNLKQVAISRQLMAIRSLDLNQAYIHIFVKSKFEYLQEKGLGIAIPGIGRRDVLEIQFPLPPLAEQKRIVTKFDKLMAFCDELEKKLRQSSTVSEMLIAAVVDKIIQN
jgi:type I restriction enzyme S subunit